MEQNSKQCTKCSIIKPLTDYHKNKKGKFGRQPRCKECLAEDFKERYPKYKRRMAESQRNYVLNNKETIITKRREYYKKNRDNIAKTRRLWYNRTIEKRRAYEREYNKIRRQDPKYRVRQNFKSRLVDAIRYKGSYKSKRTEEILGCTVKALYNYLESLFTEGMSWDNYGEWHVDHIVPIAAAKTVDDVYKLNHYSNLQPLWAKDNLRKAAKMPEDVGGTGNPLFNF